MKNLIAMFVFLLSFPLAVFADNAANSLNARLAQLNSFSAQFKQQVLSDDGSLLQANSGEVYIQRPGKFRWVTDEPLKQLIITDGSQLWIYEPDLEQVTVRQLEKNLGQTPLLLLTTNNMVIEKNFSVTALTNRGKGKWYQLLPRSSEDGFKKITIEFNGNHLVYLELYNQLDQTTKIYFSKVRLNSALPASLFVFKIPKGVDVVNMAESQ